MLLSRTSTSLLLALIGFGTFFWRAPASTAFPAFLHPVPVARGMSVAPVFSSHVIPNLATAHAHAASQVELPDGRIMAFWYGGTREGAQDVAIYQATFDPNTEKWSEQRAVATREKTRSAFRGYAKKIGNAVAVMDRKEVLWLFYVSTSVGGWGTSSINVMTSADLGKTWSAPGRLIASPFLNISHLVKGAPVLLADGSIGLPAYHEFAGGKFSEWLHIGMDKQVINRSRITSGGYAIQPSIVPLADRQAMVFMRDSGRDAKRVHASFTNDAAKTWSPSYTIPVKNPNAAVAVQRISEYELIMVFNDDEEERHNLTLAYSSDAGQHWRNIAVLENEQGLVPAGTKEREYSYPYLLQAKDSTIHLLYTWHTTHIKHLYFNQAWLRERTK